MRYVVKNELGYYKFFRKIPFTNKQFIFSLRTKNYKIACKIARFFLIKSDVYFRSLQNLSKEIVMNRLDEIQERLDSYKEEALKEYSELEASRHKHFTHNNEDGSSPNSILHWTKELQQYIMSSKTKEEMNEMVHLILKRSPKELQHYYTTLLSKEDKELFAYLLIKTEASILHIDYERAERYFNPLYNLKLEQEARQQAAIINTLQSNITVSQDNVSTKEKKFHLKTKQELYDEFLEEYAHRKNELDKITSTLQTLLLSSEHEYLNDYQKANYDVFFSSLCYTPAGIALKKRIFTVYDKNYVAIAEDFQNEELDSYGYTLEPQSISTVKEKMIMLNNFMKFCKKNGYIEDNIFEDNPRYNVKVFASFLKRSQDRMPFEKYELEKMFELMIENKFFSKNIEKFYIPMVALFSGMRIEEIAQLRKCDIVCENEIYYFNVNRYVKTDDSVRKVPLHKFLISKLRFLEFIKSKKADERLFNLKPIILNQREKYSHYYVMDFIDLRNQFVSEVRINDDLISFHSFRHTFASRLSESEVEDHTISKLLGHSCKSNETPRYTHKNSLEKLHKKTNTLYIKDIEVSLNKLANEFKQQVSF